METGTFRVKQGVSQRLLQIANDLYKGKRKEQEGIDETNKSIIKRSKDK
ncbi:hypothetical protein [Peribacillus loiseleuriae]|nr:hypothetical protein [Peribacillus loiseleuriae]